MQDIVANQLELNILGYLKNNVRGTTILSYELPNFGYDVFFLETAFKFLREKKYIHIEIVDEKIFLGSVFKLKITDAGDKFYDEQQKLIQKQNDEFFSNLQPIPLSPTQQNHQP